MENKRTETNKTVQKRLEPELKLINMDTVEVEQIEYGREYSNRLVK